MIQVLVLEVGAAMATLALVKDIHNREGCFDQVKEKEGGIRMVATRMVNSHRDHCLMIILYYQQISFLSTHHHHHHHFFCLCSNIGELF